MKIVVGVDEVGRGSWAGPLVSAAVALPENLQIDGLKDSKLLTQKQRIRLTTDIRRGVRGIGIGWVSSKEIDVYGLSWAVGESMQQAVEQLQNAFDEVIIDGNFNFLNATHPKARALPKADNTYQSVAAASVIAKVARDNYMHKAAGLYPEYGFERHVGYGTKLHQTALTTYGVTPIHRFSFRPVQQYRLKLSLS